MTGNKPTLYLIEKDLTLRLPKNKVFNGIVEDYNTLVGNLNAKAIILQKYDIPEEAIAYYMLQLLDQVRYKKFQRDLYALATKQTGTLKNQLMIIYSESGKAVDSWDIGNNIDPTSRKLMDIVAELLVG